MATTIVVAVLFVLLLAALPVLARRAWLRLRTRSVVGANWAAPAGRIVRPIPAERIRRSGGRAFISCFRVA